MGRGGGSGGRSSGGFSSGGSRGFSCYRSSGSSSGRGGGRRNGSSRTYRSSGSSYSGRFYGGMSRPLMPQRPPGMTVLMASGRGSAPSACGKRASSAAGGMQQEGGRKPPFGILAAIAAIAAAMCVIFGILMALAKDTGQREKLDASVCVSSDAWIDDRLGWLADTGQVTEAMRYFYQKTGVQPYLLICDSLGGKGREITEAEAEEELRLLYDSLYSDEGHMIYAFMEYADSQYITWIYTGRAADTVVDSDARGIFLSNADRYYTDSSLTDDGYFSRTFRKSADAIMKDGSARQKVFAACMSLAGVMASVSLAGFIWLVRKEAKRKELEQLKKFLDAPVGQSPDTRELENKYRS